MNSSLSRPTCSIRAYVQSIAASKAARIVTAAQGRQVVDFGSQRSRGMDAALQVARTSFLADVLQDKLQRRPG